MSSRQRRNNIEGTGLTAVSILLVVTIFVLCFYFLPLDKWEGQDEVIPYEPVRVRLTSAVKSLNDLFTTVDLMDATIDELEKEMEAGNLTSEQLTQMYIDRINAYDKSLGLNSVIALNPSALEDSRELDRERAEGKVRGPLHGIPVIVKANIDVEGMATSAGARILSDMIAPKDAFIVKKLRDSGAVIIGQANMSEFAYATVSSRSTLGGVTHNAYDLTRTPGGSSGGTAVAVTCNFAAAGIGTDTGGSIRNPSSFSNLYGLRPSKGLTSVSGILPLKAYKDSAGPMTRTAEDLALVTEIIAGVDWDDDYTLEVKANALKGDGYGDSLEEDGLEGMRIGYLSYSFRYGSTVPASHVQEMLDRTLEIFTASGAEVVDISDIFTNEMIWSMDSGMNTDTFEYDLNKYLNEKGSAARYKTLRELFYSDFTGTMHMYLDNVTGGGMYFASLFENTYYPYTETASGYERVPGWSRMLTEREKITQLMEENHIDCVMYLNFFDVPEVEQPQIRDPYNPASYDIVFGPKHGLPEISLPMGFASQDSGHPTELPLGLSVFTAFGREETLFRLAFSYEQQAGEDIRRMPETVPALPDERLNQFLDELIYFANDIAEGNHDQAHAVKIRNMMDAIKKAGQVDRNDPYAVYNAAKDLAQAFDIVRMTLGL